MAASSTKPPISSGSSRTTKSKKNHHHPRLQLHTLLNYSEDKRQPIIPVEPKPVSKCPLLCCFYSEFDIKKGPIIRCQSPLQFMDQDIHLPLENMQNLLQTAFEELEQRGEAVGVTEPPTSKRQDEGLEESKTNGGEVKSSSKDILDAEAGGADVQTEPIDHTFDHPPSTPAGLSIFDSTSDFIITGAELTSKIITLSTHSWHVMTRPTLISDSRYERNSHLFSVGFLLRRAADPNPFRPLLSKLAMTLQAMEEESRFLSSPQHRPKLQVLLERVLLSLNSAEYECNLLLSPSNALNLKLYHPPKPETPPVHEYQVPVLLRRDLHLQTYDWDLAINWVILHIDGTASARQISVKAEVDLEMVLACLRVLKHHGVITMISPFSYSNRYEFTTKATAALAGKDGFLLQEGLAFCLKRGEVGGSQQSPSSPTPHSPSRNQGSESDNISELGASSNHNLVGTPYSLVGFSPSSSYPPRTALGSFSQRSGRFVTMAAASSLEQESSPALRAKSNSEYRWMKSAMAELFCACSRNLSFGDLWIALTSTNSRDGLPTRVVVPNPQAPRQGNAFANRRATRSGSISEDRVNESTMGSSLPGHLDSRLSPSETYHLDSLRRFSGDQGSQSFEWSDFFERVDHRRFTTFGLIHGWIVRIHCFPCFPYPFPPPPQSTSRSPILNPMAGVADIDTNATTESGGSVASISKNDYLTARMAASLMDGTRCDDEIASALERPFPKIISLVEQYGRHEVICLYAEKSEGVLPGR